MRTLLKTPVEIAAVPPERDLGQAVVKHSNAWDVASTKLLASVAQHQVCLAWCKISQEITNFTQGADNVGSDGCLATQAVWCSPPTWRQISMKASDSFGTNSWWTRCSHKYLKVNVCVIAINICNYLQLFAYDLFVSIFVYTSWKQTCTQRDREIGLHLLNPYPQQCCYLQLLSRWVF